MELKDITDNIANDIELVIGGKPKYSIIRSHAASDTIVKLVASIGKYLSQVTGTIVPIKTDRVKKGQLNDSSSYEILIGLTNYSETKEVLDEISYSEYAIKKVENKLVIAAWTPVALAKAAYIFKRDIRSNPTYFRSNNKDLVLPADIYFSGITSKIISDIPKYPNMLFNGIYDVGENNYLLLVENTNSSDFDKYTKYLKTLGYEKYAENTINNNRYVTYTNQEYIINAGYVEKEKTVRVIIEPNGNLPGLASENTYTPIVKSTLTQLGLEYPLNDGTICRNGMSYIIRLADGKFILIDGGHNREIDSDQIYETLYNQAPDKDNITIAAWIITHSHADHVGAFRKFAEDHAQKVRVERFIANFPSTQQTIIVEGNQDNSIRDIQRRFKLFEGSVKMRAHTGQIYNLANAKIEILHTAEDFIPQDLLIYNYASLVFSIQIEGQRIMFLADSELDLSDLLVEKYGSSLKSDMVQLSHHGLRGATVDLYKNIAAPIIFWPSNIEMYNTRKTSAWNQEAFSHLKYKVDEVGVKNQDVFIASNYIQTIELPYNPSI